MQPVVARAHAGLCNWRATGPDATLAVPTPEHYLPLLHALALQREDDRVSIFNDDVFATLAMASCMIGTGALRPDRNRVHRVSRAGMHARGSSL